MTSLVRTTLWLMFGHALAGAAYLALIYTPESNVLMLAVSVALVLLGVAALVWTSTSAALALHTGGAPWRGGRRVSSMLPGVVLAGALGDAWVARAGEVDAAAIAAGDVTRTAWLHTTVRWAVALVQWAVVPVWLAASLAWAAAYGSRHVVSMKWLLVGLTPRVLLVALGAVALLVWLPWRALYWRPASLSSTTLEMAFSGIKLLGLYAAANLAWALVLDAAARAVRR